MDIDSENKIPKLPKRSKRFGVGKEIGGAVYVHREYASSLGEIVATAAEKLPSDFEYHIVKLNLQSKAVSFVSCEDFDTADEPTVGIIVTVSVDGQVRSRRQSADPEIYHHKWLFVADDYGGFDVAESRQHSLNWLSLNDIDSRRIGRRQFWEQNVVPRIGRSSD